MDARFLALLLDVHALYPPLFRVHFKGDGHYTVIFLCHRNEIPLAEAPIPQPGSGDRDLWRVTRAIDGDGQGMGSAIFQDG